MYYIIYFSIGLLFGLASCLKRWSSYEELNRSQKIYVKLSGEIHWAGFIVIFISRLLIWPIYIISGIIK